MQLCTTANISKLGESDNFKVNTQNKHNSGLIMMWPEIPAYSYLRTVQAHSAKADQNPNLFVNN